MKFLARIVELDKVIGIICLYLTILSVLVHVFLRLISHPIIGAQELESYLFVFMVYISVGYVTREDGHIRFDTLLLSFPPRVQSVVRRILNGSCAMVFGITTYSAIVTMLTNAANKTPNLGIPFIVYILPMIVGFFLMTIEYSIYALSPHVDAKKGIG